MRILVTGGLGVNGSWVVRGLCERGIECLVIDNRDDRSLVGEVGERFSLVVGDATDLEQLRRLIGTATVDVVIHMAAIIDADRNPVAAVDVNVRGMAAVCEAARAGGVSRVVFTSSRAVYGSLAGEFAYPTYRPVPETHATRPFALYDVTKLAAEEIGRWYRRTHALEVVSLRFGTILGPGKLVRHGGFSTYSSMLEFPAQGRPVELVQGGDEGNDIVYVADVADAIIATAIAPKLAHDVYNIGSGVTYTLHDVAAAVRSQIPDAQIAVGGGLDPLHMGVNCYGALDSSRARTDLGWEPRFDLEAAVADYLKRLKMLGA
jgi:UDP-glucose 4-epimerase